MDQTVIIGCLEALHVLFAKPLMLTGFSYQAQLRLSVVHNFPEVQFEHCYIGCSNRGVTLKLFDELS